MLSGFESSDKSPEAVNGASNIFSASIGRGVGSVLHMVYSIPSAPLFIDDDGGAMRNMARQWYNLANKYSY
jgi:hypothetical protein